MSSPMRRCRSDGTPPTPRPHAAALGPAAVAGFLPHAPADHHHRAAEQPAAAAMAAVAGAGLSAEHGAAGAGRAGSAPPCRDNRGIHRCAIRVAIQRPCPLTVQSMSNTSALVPHLFEGHRIRVSTDQQGEAWIVVADACAALAESPMVWAMANRRDEEEHCLLEPSLGNVIREAYAVCSPAIHGEPATEAQVEFVKDVGPQLAAALRTIQ
jgi:hypothetical protein